MMRNRRITFGLATLAILATAALTHACPMCKDSIPTGGVEQASTLSSGFNNSIYLFLVAYLTLAVSLATMIVKAVRASNKQAAVVTAPIKLPARDQRSS